MRLTAWRSALRIARRDAVRAKGRSALVLAMIALPVLGVTGADVMLRSADLSPAEHATRVMGRADAMITASDLGRTILQAPDPQSGTMTQGDGTETPTAEQKRAREGTPAEALAALLPPGTTLTPEGSGPRTTTTTKEGRMSVGLTEADLTLPLRKGMVDLVGGSAPSQPQQIAVTQAFLDQSKLRIGDATALHGLEGKPYTITGVVEYPGDLKRVELVGRPGALFQALAESPKDKVNADPHSWLVSLPTGSAALDWPAVLKLNQIGFVVTSRAVLVDPPARADVPYYTEMAKHGWSSAGVSTTALAILATVVGMALLEIVLLAGPAFAVGARRSRRQLGLLAAGGGDRAHVRAVVLGGGVVLGLAGAMVGVVLAIALVAVFRPLAEDLAGSRFGHFALEPLDLLAIAAVGLVTGLLAAVVPAVQASRQDVVEALTGRGSIKPANRIIAVLGLVMVVAGSTVALGTAAAGRAVTVGLLGGSAIAELGMVLCTPTLVGLFGRLGRMLPLSPRLALRDAVRHRGRTAPAVAAVMAAVAGSVAVGIYTASADEQSRRDYVAMLPSGAVSVQIGWGTDGDPGRLSALRDAVQRNVADLGERADIGDLRTGEQCRQHPSRGCAYIRPLKREELRCPLDGVGRPDPGAMAAARNDPRCHSDGLRSGGYGEFGNIAVGDAAALHLLFGVHDPAAEQALAAGKALVFLPDYLKDGRTTLEIENVTSPTSGGAAQPEPSTRQIAVDAVAVSSPHPYGTVLLSPAAAKAAGLDSVVVGSLWQPAAPPSSTAEQKTTAAVAAQDDGASLTVERGYRSNDSLFTIGLTAFAGLVALGAAGIATGLAAADSQQDLTTLAAVGAHGGIRRRLSGFQCGVIAAMGAVLGTVCGVVPAVALRLLEGQGQKRFLGPLDKVPDTVIAVPWAQLLATAVGLPLLALALAALLTRSRITLTRRAA
ncbi:FtsX-like permease family protein [Kitasatospora sp. NPDC049285]|uniref:FtsX-like permease family protein n=1 Tax=Kitasatospora sp. NPDC049285 TaxID=3157096 RepID=UPI003426E817